MGLATKSLLANLTDHGLVQKIHIGKHDKPCVIQIKPYRQTRETMSHSTKTMCCTIQIIIFCWRPLQLVDLVKLNELVEKVQKKYLQKGETKSLLATMIKYKLINRKLTRKHDQIWVAQQNDVIIQNIHSKPYQHNCESITYVQCA